MAHHDIDPLFDVRTIDVEKHPECQYMTLVVGTVRRLLKRVRNQAAGLTFEDLVQTGCLVLYRCHPYRDRVGSAYTAYLKTALRRRMTELIRRERPTAPLREDGPAEARLACEGGPWYEPSDLAALGCRLGRLPERERWVLALHYGLGGEAPLSFTDIGRLWPGGPVSRQRVEWVHGRAVQRLRKLLT